MSIENNLKTLADNSTRIADALEGLLAKMSHIGTAVSTTETVAPTTPKPPVPDTAAVAPSMPVTPAQPAAVPPAPPAAPVTPAPTTPPQAPTPAAAAPSIPQPASMTPEELNTALVAEFQRLGSREHIDNAIRELGATTISDLPAQHYQALLDKVRAIPA